MLVSWAAVASCPTPPPTPTDRYEALISTYEAKPLRLVLLEVLGLLGTPLCGEHSPALPLIEHCVVVCVDTEAWTTNTDEMTEIGLVVAEYADGKKLNGDLGQYAENVLKKMKYHHLRICENAHLRTNADWMRGPEGNRFGESRFVTFAEARSILDEVLNQTITSDNPAVAGLKRPIVLIGHALAHDKDNVRKTGLNYDFKQHGSVVKEIDTQKVVKETLAWIDPRCANNDIGLDTLCEKVFGFAHDDPHTALNDAARTVICAVNLALRNWTRNNRFEKTVQEVALELEQYTQNTFESNWGTKLCCTRCGGRDHSNTQNECATPVHCAACERFHETTDGNSEVDKKEHMSSHIEQYCLAVAEFNAWKRRVNDAHRKRNSLPAGPPPGSHPPSKWRGRWPMKSPSDMLVPEPPPPFVRPVLATQGDVPATSAPVPGVRRIVFQSTGRQRPEKARGIRKQVPRGADRNLGDGDQAAKKKTRAEDVAWNGTAW
ncbi:hypothetical protein BDU57DRAFT_80419 [Ampelomyces quisqualis]|uniref:Gfd2/YDR514C-like C-terminal domain-containing protein n=1 Tax=Ampelomyces quisqualis TaxID=50730 RepID=A0A6A5Q9W0_AMPQU|nr:hypothetical protein BDU57DRAFT_80419 [Ampelomyces quisqualis]